MENDYNFWADLLTTYRANPNWLKFFWVIIPASLLILAGTGLSRWVQLAITAKTGENGENGEGHKP